MTIWLFIAQLATVVAVIVALYRPLGDYLAWVFTTPRHLRVERGFYRVVGVSADAEQSWPAYFRSVLAFSAVGILLVYALQRLQPLLPYSLGLPATSEHLAFNTAISFVTNTNWQSYSPDVTLGYTVQLAGLAVQNFVSAAVGIAVAVALIRGLSVRLSGTIGNFWVDLTRVIVRVLHAGQPLRSAAHIRPHGRRQPAGLRGRRDDGGAVPPVVEFDDVVVDLSARLVTRAGATVRLTPTEWRLLEVLVRHSGKPVTRETLLTEVWGPQYTTDTGYLRLYMSQLRKKLEVDPSTPRHLVTEAGQGYRFTP